MSKILISGANLAAEAPQLEVRTARTEEAALLAAGFSPKQADELMGLVDFRSVYRAACFARYAVDKQISRAQLQGILDMREEVLDGNSDALLWAKTTQLTVLGFECFYETIVDLHALLSDALLVMDVLYGL